MRAMFSTACSPGAPSISFILARPRSYFLSSGMRAPFSSGESAVIEKEKPQVSRQQEIGGRPELQDLSSQFRVYSRKEKGKTSGLGRALWNARKLLMSMTFARRRGPRPELQLF